MTDPTTDAGLVVDAPYPRALELYPTLRQSRLATFDNCALASKFDMEHREHWNSHRAACGTILHRAIAKCLTQMANLGENTIDVEDALAVLRECLRQHDVDDRDVVNVPFSEIKNMRWVMKKWANDNLFDVQHLATIEERLQAPLAYPHPDGTGWVPRIFTGQLDALFIPEPTWGVVLDWKDTWMLPRASELSESGYFQQRAYAFLVLTRYPALDRVTLREFYLRYSEAREATIFRSELEDIREELGALAERFDRAVEQGAWPIPEHERTGKPEPHLWTPSPGAHCTYCPRPASCPIFPAARVEGAITDEGMAEQWAAEQMVAKAAVKQRDKALRAWASAQGPVKIKHAKDPNRVLGWREATRTSRPTKEQLERALAEQGADLDPSTLYKTDTTTRFEPHSADEIPDSADDADLMNALDESIRQTRHVRASDGEGD